MHDMKLHEVIVVGVYRIIRVPGGWIYERQTKKISRSEREVELVFVPYSEQLRAPSS